MYMPGFRHHHQTEAKSGSLPKEQNSPQNCPMGLYCEQQSGSAFTKPRQLNLRSWLYRLKPSVISQAYSLCKDQLIAPLLSPCPPLPIRYRAQPNAVDAHWLEGLEHIASTKLSHVFTYACNRHMINQYFSSRDGELLFIPYEGALLLITEYGQLSLSPGEIGVVPRGVFFRVELMDANANGYLCENKGEPFDLPELGVIGANALANPRHFLYPHAYFEEKAGDVELVCKFQDTCWRATHQPSPINVVAWQGNYAPYKYDLALFNTINTVSFDHPDPSIFTVLTSNSAMAGEASLDFVIFPPRWMVAEHTFRPPYFHRNVMNECMGLIQGKYDAKDEGFHIGALSLHNCMTPHGPDVDSYQKGIHNPNTPEYYSNTLAFMLEANQPWISTEKAFKGNRRETDYHQCWAGF